MKTMSSREAQPTTLRQVARAAVLIIAVFCLLILIMSGFDAMTEQMAERAAPSKGEARSPIPWKPHP